MQFFIHFLRHFFAQKGRTISTLCDARRSSVAIDSRGDQTTVCAVDAARDCVAIISFATVRRIVFFSRDLSLLISSYSWYSSATAAKPRVTMTGGVRQRYDNVIKSQEDDRQYRALVLDNGMKVLLVHDPKADKSAAALGVGVGSLETSFWCPF